jgi:hypothetical protein
MFGNYVNQSTLIDLKLRVRPYSCRVWISWYVIIVKLMIIAHEILSIELNEKRWVLSLSCMYRRLIILWYKLMLNKFFVARPSHIDDLIVRL